MTHPIHSADSLLADQVSVWRKEIARLNDLIAHAVGAPIHSADAERAAFEAATPGYNHLRSLYGRYRSDYVESAWQGWMARAAAQVGANGAAVGKYDVLPVYKRRARGVQNGDAVLEEFYAADDVRKYLDSAAGAPAETPKPVGDLFNQMAYIAAHSREELEGLSKGRLFGLAESIICRAQNAVAAYRTAAATIGAGEGKDALDAARYRWLCDNNFDREGETQIHTTVKTWAPHSQTGEPQQWSARVRGGALDREIDAAMRSKTSPGEAG